MADGWTIAGTVAVSVSAAVTAVMAYYTRRAAERTAAMAEAAQKEAEAVVAQGESIRLQAEATAAQAQSTAEQATAVAIQAEAAGHQVELTRQSLEASFQPWLTLGTREEAAGTIKSSATILSGGLPEFFTSESADLFAASVTLRNVGTGLAVIDAINSQFIGWKDPRSGENEMMPFTRAQISDPIVRPGEQARLTFEVPLARWRTDVRALTNQQNGDGEFAVDIVYGDTNGRQATRLRIRIARMAATNRWVPFELNYFRPPDAPDPSPSVRMDRQ